MFDALVITTADPEPAAHTFATLVEGVVAGMVRRVVLLSAGDSAGLRALADASGSRMALGLPRDGFGAAIKEHTETPHVIALEAGALLPPDWPNLLRQDLQRRGPPPADAGLAFRPGTLSASLGVQAILLARARLPLRHGALVPTAALVAPAFEGTHVRTGGRWALGRITVARSGGW